MAIIGTNIWRRISMHRLLSILVVLAVCSPPCQANESDNIEMVKAMTEAINSRD